MAMTPRIWSLSALAVELGCNLRTISGALANVPADGELDRGKGWLMVTALAALGATIPIRGHRLNGKANEQTGEAYTQSRTSVAQERAQLLRIQREVAQGKYISIEEMDYTLRTMVMTFRSAALRMPTTAAPSLVGKKTAVEAKAALSPFINDMLLDLQNVEIIAKEKPPGMSWEDYESA
jgi:hypothetical protein